MKRDAAGFTLIEIMAAVAILGLAVFMLLQAHYGALRLFEASRDSALWSERMEDAAAIAEMAAVRLERSGLGDFGERFEGWEYEFEVQPYESDLPGVSAVEVTVRTPEKERTVTFLVYDRALAEGS